jgi:hypothetical protein
LDVKKGGENFARYNTGPKESTTIYLCNNNIRELKESRSQKRKKETKRNQ